MELITKISNKNYKVDLSNNRITFLDTRFYFDENGVAVPSVTTVLEAFPKSSQFYDWLKKNGENSDEIRDEAGRRGSKVHQLTEMYDAGEEISLLNLESGDINMKMGEWAMIEKYIDFRNRYEVEIHGSEYNMANAELGFGGTLDRDWTIVSKGKRYLTDIKTSNNIWDEYWLQLVAYQKLVEKEKGYNPYDGRAILWLNAKTKTDGTKGAIQGKGWQLIIDEDDCQEQWEIFQATQKLWQAKNGSQKPKELSYCLKHKLIS